LRRLFARVRNPSSGLAIHGTFAAFLHLRLLGSF